MTINANTALPSTHSPSDREQTVSFENCVKSRLAGDITLNPYVLGVLVSITFIIHVCFE